ncbi:MAG: transcriptional repressor [Alphaproteobacteria bacterium]|nr:transcriptional repressor [Alphaproteobacteria bacterium]MDX5368383.1 transcriptional repressor [Alphaproteobacteria bacterium]MDX5463178.1 transcriptional repressor [Alphaproteobacteria bacterium]
MQVRKDGQRGDAAQDARIEVELRDAGLRPTRQRMALAGLLLDGPHRHVTAEALHAEALKAGVKVSLATVYNTLNQFTEAGLLRQVVVDPSRTYFDTNVSDHHHFFFESEGMLQDIEGESIRVEGLPPTPDGTALARVDVVVRVRKS